MDGAGDAGFQVACVRFLSIHSFSFSISIQAVYKSGVQPEWN